MQTANHNHLSSQITQRWPLLIVAGALFLSVTTLVEAKGPREQRVDDNIRFHVSVSQHDARSNSGSASHHASHGNRHRNYDDHRGGYHQGRHNGWEAQRRARADHYAERAVEQAREARHYGFYFDSPRWTTNYRRHYYWALDAGPDQIRSEIRARERRLMQIRHELQFSTEWEQYGYRNGQGHSRH